MSLVVSCSFADAVVVFQTERAESENLARDGMVAPVFRFDTSVDTSFCDNVWIFPNSFELPRKRSEDARSHEKRRDLAGRRATCQAYSMYGIIAQ